MPFKGAIAGDLQGILRSLATNLTEYGGKQLGRRSRGISLSSNVGQSRPRNSGIHESVGIPRNLTRRFVVYPDLGVIYPTRNHNLSNCDGLRF
jgi:hypothetical protein